MQLHLNQLRIDVDDLIAVAREAGEAVLDVYRRDFQVEYKSDDSPLTLADCRSNEIIVAGLNKLAPAIPIVSEESPLAPYEERKNWDYFWLVDPLDGTKEFVARTNEFTINIALICSQEPILGVVYAPALDLMYYAIKDGGSFRVEASGARIRLSGEFAEASDELVIVGSRSHHSPAIDEFIDGQREGYAQVRFLAAGSALKFCLVAEGKAHIYPRLAPTREWDTAAAHMVAAECGKSVLQYHNGEALTYNKPDLLNPWFICR